MHGLSSEQLKTLNKWTGTKLLDTFEGYSDRVYLMALQDAAGVAHKSSSDPDVAGLIDTYEKLKGELEKRLKPADKELAMTLEGHSRTIVHNTAHRYGTLGVPNDEKSNAQMTQAKSDYNSTYALIEKALSG